MALLPGIVPAQVMASRAAKHYLASSLGELSDDPAGRRAWGTGRRSPGALASGHAGEGRVLGGLGCPDADPPRGPLLRPTSVPSDAPGHSPRGCALGSLRTRPVLSRSRGASRVYRPGAPQHGGCEAHRTVDRPSSRPGLLPARGAPRSRTGRCVHIGRILASTVHEAEHDLSGWTYALLRPPSAHGREPDGAPVDHLGRARWRGVQPRVLPPVEGRCPVPLARGRPGATTPLAARDRSRTILSRQTRPWSLAAPRRGRGCG